MKSRMRLITPVLAVLVWGMSIGVASAGPAPKAPASSPTAKSGLKPLGVPKIKETVLTREQAKAQQEMLKKRDQEMVKEAEARRNALYALASGYAKQGISIHQFHSIYRLIDPALGKVDPKARKAQGALLVKAFRAKIEPVVKKKVSVELYSDPKEKNKIAY